VNKPYTFHGKTALFFGDSITKGHTDGNTVTPNSFPKLFAERVGMSFTNLAVSGTTLSEGIANAIKSTSLNSDFVFIAGGVNDWQLGVALSTFRANLIDLCSYLKTSYAGEVIFITPINEAGWISSKIVADLQEYRNIITEVAIQNGFSVVQGSLFNFPTKDGNADYIASIFGDKLHPSELGYQLYAKGLATALCGADGEDSASAVQGNLDTHTANKSNPHEVTLGQLGVTATTTELNYINGVTSNIQTQFDNLSKIYIGTQEQYDIADAKGLVPVGAIVIIVDEEFDYGSTSAELGYAILGQMILGLG
jgi:lysophospholipase L1-like esterase